MEEKNAVPYIFHEGCLARDERIIKRLVIALIIAIVLMFASNGLWLYAWMQYDYEGETTRESIVTAATQDGEGVNIFGSGDVNYGATDSNSDQTDDNEESSAAETE